jgi:hypothetical protein
VGGASASAAFRRALGVTDVAAPLPPLDVRCDKEEIGRKGKSHRRQRIFQAGGATEVLLAKRPYDAKVFRASLLLRAAA